MGVLRKFIAEKNIIYPIGFFFFFFARATLFVSFFFLVFCLDINHDPAPFTIAVTRHLFAAQFHESSGHGVRLDFADTA